MKGTRTPGRCRGCTWLLTLTLTLTLTLALAAAAALAAADPANSGPVPERRISLPTDVTPEHYRIEITPDAGALTFTGAVQIDISVHKPTARIVLNSADIVIDRAALSGEAADPAIGYDSNVQTATLTFDHAVAAGAYTLSLVYHGKIYQQASGLFALDYDTPAGRARALFTQFENSDARRFVPCWDEPGVKATFQLTATVPAGQMALSNMPVESTDSPSSGRKTVHFATTPKMSSYLLFFGSGDFERVNRNVDGVDVGVVVKRGDTASTDFALDAATHILPYYNAYFGTPYPLPKLDLIAAPGASQFFGAMENWGAIFYFERDILIDARVSTQDDRQNVYIVVAHEMAHQWFGDLVTMAWWDDLWLNEGFASWMENKVTDHFHPEWKVWLQSLREKQSAMAEDARDGTHPIITTINDVQQASGAFDGITYLKGAAVIRTLESYLGEDEFRAGVRRYMHDHAYGNTVTDDLWKEIDAGSKRPIRQIAHDLTLQAGVPMVSETTQRCAIGKTTLGLSQGHFAIDADSTSARLWHLPVTVAAVGGTSAAAVVAGPARHMLTVQGCGAIILNAGQTAYFRSRYSQEGLAAVTAQYGTLSTEDQLGLLNDGSALAYAGDEPMAALLALMTKIPADADPVLAAALVSVLKGMDTIYTGLPTQPAFREFARGLLTPLYTRIGWEKSPGESDNVALLRSSLIDTLGDLGDAVVVAQARRRFDGYRADPSQLDAGTRRIVLNVVAASADQAVWDQLHAMAKSAKTEIERRELYALLGTAESRALAQEALDLALPGEPAPTIAPEIIGAASRRHPEQTLDFTVDHWDQLAALLEPASQARFVPGLMGSATDLKLLDKLESFAAAHIPADARQDVRKAEAGVRYRAKIRSNRLPEVTQWINNQEK